MTVSPPSLVVAVVEDDEACRKALARLLGTAGFSAATFGSAEAYLDAAPAPEPACLILDLSLPGMSGLELQRRLQAVGSAPPIIITTAVRDGGVREAAERNGCAAFFSKPVDGGTLLDVIASLAGRTAGRAKMGV
jgi:FixJ family two-component response regulator